MCLTIVVQLFMHWRACSECICLKHGEGLWKSENLYFLSLHIHFERIYVTSEENLEWSWSWSEGENVRTQPYICHFLVSLLVLKPYAVSSQASENGFDAFALAVLPYIWKFLHQKPNFHLNRGSVLQRYDVSQVDNHTVQPGGCWLLRKEKDKSEDIIFINSFWCWHFWLK